LGNVRILVLDEPTSALPSGEESALFEAIRHVTDRGVGVVYVTHRLREVFELSQRITVLRDGLEVGTFATVDIDMRGLVAAIIGRGHDQLASGTADAEGDDGSSEPKERYSSEAAPPTGEPFLDLRGVSNDRLRAVDLSVAPGEIVGLAGLAGSGRTEILETAFGLRPVVSGQMLIGGQAANLHNTSDAIQMGIAMVPEDRPGQGLVMSHSLEQNIAMPRLDKLTRLGLFQREASQARSREAMQELSIKAPTTHTIVGNLSGGNQQKVVFGKWRAPRPDLLLLDEPTTGVDVGAREEIYGVMRRAAAAGSAVLLVCSDLDELLQLCHRIAIVADGKVVLTVSRAEAGNEQNLHHLVNMSQPLGEEPRA
jgi:ribose transport system ATP-binding protein